MSHKDCGYMHLLWLYMSVISNPLHEQMNSESVSNIVKEDNSKADNSLAKNEREM